MTSNTPLTKEDNRYTHQHHYLASSPKVAKLFASKNARGAENEVIYRALNQSLNAMIYLRRRESIIPDIQSQRMPELASVEMPVILCNSFAHFHQVDMDAAKSTPQPIHENFQLEVNYAYRDLHGTDVSEYFLLDIVNFERFDDYLNVLEFDKDAMFHVL